MVIKYSWNCDDGSRYLKSCWYHWLFQHEKLWFQSYFYSYYHIHIGSCSTRHIPYTSMIYPYHTHNIFIVSLGTSEKIPFSCLIFLAYNCDLVAHSIAYKIKNQRFVAVVVWLGQIRVLPRVPTVWSQNLTTIKYIFFTTRTRDHSGYGLGQWEKALHSNASSHWLSPYPEWSLHTGVNLCRALQWRHLSLKVSQFTSNRTVCRKVSSG